MRLPFFLCLGLLVSGCYRPAPRTVTLNLPDVTQTEELTALKLHLLSMENHLKKEQKSLLDITISPNPPALIVTYTSDKMADRNVEDLLHRVGYEVNDLPGDPVRRALFRKRLLSP